MRPLVIALAAVGLAGTGCYTYVPASVEDVRVGTEVRAHLSRPAVERFQEIGLAREAIDGRLTQRDSTGLVVETKAWSTTTYLYGQGTVRQPVELAPQDIVAVSVRRLDRLKTGVAAGLVAGGGIAIIASVLNGVFSGDENDPGEIPPEEPDAFRVPIRIPVSW